MMQWRSILLLPIFTLAAFALPDRIITVAQNGRAEFTSIQSAVASVPNDHRERVIITVKNGVYREKLFIRISNIAIVGESRDSTIIEYAELRKNWLKQNPSDWGSATVNIDSATADITFANLTVRNNYGALYGDHDHQFTVWGKGTRIIFVYCNVLGDGGDTMSLWNSVDGMYYHAECTFEGWVDYVCPRGWCYITDSRFFGHNLTASLWHHGAADKDQKFVIRSSYFDGVPGFPLGRHHVDGQFYLLDCIFARTMADAPIHYPSYSPNARPWKWGERHYFFGCHREGGDYDWFADNLATAEGSPLPEQITPRWTFRNRWDPDSSLAGILPFVSFPVPRSASYLPAVQSVPLRWIPVRGASRTLVRFGTDEHPPVAATPQSASWDTPVLRAGTRYYWRIDAVTGTDTLAGPLWHFTLHP